jgi:hypothetical protein
VKYVFDPESMNCISRNGVEISKKILNLPRIQEGVQKAMELVVRGF